MHKIKSPARMRQGRHGLDKPICGFETTRPFFEDSESAPLRISRKRHTASGGLPVHESVSMPSAHAVGTAFKTGEHVGIRAFKAVKGRLKSSKDSAYRTSLRFLASDAHEFQSSKDAIAAEAPSKDFGGIGA